MLQFLRQLLAGVAEAWRRLSINARVQIAAAAVLSLVLIAAAVTFGSQAQYARLYNRLDLDESQQIAVWLTDEDIPFKTYAGGAEIRVPIKEVSRVKMGLSGLNLPKSQGVAPGWELFDNRDLMSNQFLQDVDYMRALQGELQRTLNQYDFIRRSFVFIRESPEQLFVSAQRPSQASVILDTTGPLTKAQVKAVVHTVSSFGGANLTRQNIAVSLSDGTILHSPSEDDFASVATEKHGVQFALEQEKENKIRRMFDDLGVNVSISVTASMDWTSEERKNRTVTEGATISSLISESTTTTTDKPPEGPPGALAQIPEELGGGGSTGVSTSDEETLENFDPSETVVSTSIPPGSVKKFWVSALIEGDYGPAVDGVDGTVGEPDYLGLTDEEITLYKDIIEAAVGSGLEATEVVVYDHAFKLDRIAAAQVGFAAPLPWYQIPVVQWGLQFAAMVIALLLIRVLMRRALVMPSEEAEELVEIPEVSAAELRRQEIASEVERLSGEEPEMVAALLRTWIAEED